MNKCFLYSLSLFILLITINNVEAKCNDEYIIDKASSIFTSYRVDLGDEETETKVMVTLENVDEDMFAVVTNTTLNKKYTIRNIKNGILEVKTPSPFNIYSYTFKVYSSDPVCENELLVTINTKSVAYNNWFESDECAELDDLGVVFEGCEMFSSKKYTQADFRKQINKLKEAKKAEDEKKNRKNFFELIWENYLFAIIPMLVLGVYYGIRLFIIKRRSLEW